jgi:hypothetical protein
MSQKQQQPKQVQEEDREENLPQVVVHTCNPKYLRGWDRNIIQPRNVRPVWVTQGALTSKQNKTEYISFLP